MPRIEAPAIDGRTHDELVTDVERLIERYTGQPAAPEGDAGWALVRVFSRLAELAVTRLDRLPDRNFLAFLDLIGTRLDPPQAARVPLTFLLAKGSPVDALVPAGTQAAALPLEGETGTPVFETERDLVVTRSEFVAACTREPGRDLWADHTAIATGETAGSFQPFRGDRPIEHRLHVAHPLFGMPERKTIELWITPADESFNWLKDVTWEHWNGTAWQTIDPYPYLQLDSETAAWVVELYPVHGIATSAVNGCEGSWLHGRLEKMITPLPFIDSLSVRVKAERNWDAGDDILPDQGFAGQIPLDLSRDFLPFGEKPQVGDVFYLASDEAFSKPDARVEISVYLTPGSTQAANADPALIWEFWNGHEWQALDQDFDFFDGSQSFLESHWVRFTVPPSLAATTVNGETRRWMRVRIDRGSYGETRPSLRSLRISYWYDSGDQPPQLVLTENDFDFEPVTGSFKPFRPSEDTRPTLYLGFERPGDATGFANRTTALFFQVSEAAYDPAVEPQPVTEEASVVWEHWNGESWKRLGTRDETRGFTRRGLVTFLGPPDFPASADFGRKAFWLRGRWERGEYAVEPWLVRVLTNTMWAAHVGGGLAGNRPAGSIAQLKSTVPYIDGVVQHVPAEGGADEESLESARIRGPKSLRHRGRATAAADFEDLAFQATPQVARAQALPARSSAEGGQVGLIVVPLAREAKPVPGLELLARVRSYLEARLSPVVDFRVVGPDWLQVDIRAEVVPQQLEAASSVQTAVLERLCAFLHPLSGGPLAEGWEFGRRPHRSDLYALIEEIPGVDHVRRLEVIETPREGGARPGRFLVFSGDHEITLYGSVDDAAGDPERLP